MLQMIDDPENDVKERLAVVDIPMQKLQTTPSGYIEISMSSEGRYGVSSSVRIRNFFTEELIEISLLNDMEVPAKIISVLNGMILDEIDVALWPEEFVIELLVKIYVNFFSPTVQTTFAPTEEDLAYAKEHNVSLPSGDGKLDFTLDLRSVSTFDANTGIKQFVSVRKRKTDLSLKFLAFPRIGDTVTISRYVESKYRQFDRQFNKLQTILDRGEDLTEEQYESLIQLQDVQRQKLRDTIRATRALYLAFIGDKDVRDEPLERRIELFYSDPRIADVTLGNRLDEAFLKFKVGINPDVEVVNPITGAKCIRRFSFRLVDILQAIQTFKSDEYDLSYDD